MGVEKDPLDWFEQEVIDRLRRIETKTTAFMVSQGFDAGGTPVVWDLKHRVLKIPSRKVALQDLLDAIPAGVYSAPIEINGEYIGTLTNYAEKKP